MLSVAIIVIFMIAACIAGIVFYWMYDAEYHTSPVYFPAFAFQSAFLLLTVVFIPNPDVKIWFIVGIIGTIASYIWGIWKCRQNAIGTGLAIATQILLPIGTVFLILFFLTLISGGSNKKKKRRR